ncbi:hypothetical protein RUND412_006981 [Rhizina undulata]
MSASVASKNLYELLGNDPPEDETIPKPLPREVVKTTTTSKKRDEKPEGGNRRGGRRAGGNEEVAFRDSEAPREHTRKEGDRPPRVRGGRGDRGGRPGRREYDRHSATGKVDSEKKVEQAWGTNKAESEWADERAAEHIADATGAEAAEDNTAPAEDAAAEPVAEAAAEPEEEKQKTYDVYLAERAQRAAELGPPSEVRRPNEGSRVDKKWAAAKELSRKEEEEDAYFVGENKDRFRNRERKQKTFLDIEPRYVEPREARRGGDRGGRGGRGDRGRGPRGGRGGDRDFQNRGGPKTASHVPTLDEFPNLGA